jgi:histidinol-phosphate/aromatic aminotransferase/cobyric acid decarboxylase-like protein
MQFAGLSTQSGAVTYDLMHAEVRQLSERSERFADLLSRMEEKTDWKLGIALRQPAVCFHGGAFFDAIGETFATLERRETVINADVLDAWFPPAPGVLESLREHLPWLLRTSPPTGCAGLLQTIAERRGVKVENLLPGAGSSDLIFRALGCWLNQDSRVLLLDPTYGEYQHILEKVIQCRVERFRLDRGRGYEIDLAALERSLAKEYDLVVLVNPNSPTGRHVPRGRLLEILRRPPTRTRVWVDETYVEYTGGDQSLERAAAASENLVVCKSMSKVYALSGARVAYLCAGAHQLETLRALTPPWVVGLPAQVAAVRALEDPGYYAKRYAETHALRDALAAELRLLGWNIVPGVANFLLCHLPERGPRAGELVNQCRRHGLFIRDTRSMGSTTDASDDEVRVAVKSSEDNARMIKILKSGLGLPGSLA